MFILYNKCAAAVINWSMAMLFVYDETINGFHSCDAALLGRDACRQELLWSDARFIAACRALCARFEDVAPGCCFRRPKSRAFSDFSAHYAGLAGSFTLEPCKGLVARQQEIRRWCIKSGLFSYVEPQYRTPLWIHAEVEIARPASLQVGYPELFLGNAGAHVFLLQDMLNLAGFPCLLCGRFGEDTQSALRAFKCRVGLPSGDAVDAACWQALFAHAKRRTPL